MSSVSSRFRRSFISFSKRFVAHATTKSLRAARRLLASLPSLSRKLRCFCMVSFSSSTPSPVSPRVITMGGNHGSGSSSCPISSMERTSEAAFLACGLSALEIADVFCINKAASEVRSILEIGQELAPDPWFPPIVMTRGDIGEGVQELKDTIQEHRDFLEETGRLGERRRAALRDFVIAWATNRMEKEMHERLDREDTQLVEKVYNKELDPISASEQIFKEV